MAIAIPDVPGIGLELGLYSWTRHRIVMAAAVPPTRILSISPGLVVIRLLYSCMTILPMLTQRAQWWVGSGVEHQLPQGSFQALHSKN